MYTVYDYSVYEGLNKKRKISWDLIYIHVCSSFIVIPDYIFTIPYKVLHNDDDLQFALFLFLNTAHSRSACVPDVMKCLLGIY